MKFILDENINRTKKYLPKNSINASELYKINGLKEKGVADSRLMELANEQGFIIVTKDQGLILKANSLSIPIIFADGEKGQNWCLIPKDLRIKNRIKLIKYVSENFITEMEDLELLPFFAHRKIGDINLTEDQFYNERWENKKPV